VNALQATGGGVAFAAHVGGFLAGALLVNVFKSRTLLDRRQELLSSARWEDTPGSSGSQW